MMWCHATTIAHSFVHVHVQVLVCTCSSQVQNENNIQYPFYTVAVKHETGEFMTLTHSLAETKVQIIISSI